MPPGIVLCAGAHQELVLDLCPVDLALQTGCFSCFFAKAEPQTSKLSWLCAVMVVGGYVCMYFTSPQTTHLKTTIVLFLPSHEKHPGRSTKHSAPSWHLSCVFPLNIWLLGLLTSCLSVSQGQKMSLPHKGQWDSQGLWLAPQRPCLSLPRAKGVLRKRSKLVTRKGLVGSGSLGAQKTKTASLRDSTR